jgi:hypothetical protein
MALSFALSSHPFSPLLCAFCPFPQCRDLALIESGAMIAKAAKNPQWCSCSSIKSEMNTNNW